MRESACPDTDRVSGRGGNGTRDAATSPWADGGGGCGGTKWTGTLHLPPRHHRPAWAVGEVTDERPRRLHEHRPTPGGGLSNARPHQYRGRDLEARRRARFRGPCLERPARHQARRCHCEVGARDVRVPAERPADGEVEIWQTTLDQLGANEARSKSMRLRRRSAAVTLLVMESP